MTLQFPILRDLASWTTNNSSRDTTTSNEIWEIDVPAKNSLIWSIVMSYLIPSSCKTKSVEFQQRLNKLAGNETKTRRTMQKKTINTNFKKDAIQDRCNNFNPFKTKHAFFDEKLSSVMRTFKYKLNCETKNRANASVEFLKLPAASRILQCIIQVYISDSMGIKQFECHSPDGRSSERLPRIVIFHHAETQLKNRVKDTFGFGMDVEISGGLRMKALTYILQKGKLSTMDIAQIRQDVELDKNFLVCLLTSNNENIIKNIPKLYSSPYIAVKLSNAGFNTDPHSPRQDELSAFFYCINLADPQLLRVLYNYALNNFPQTDDATRNPNQDIIAALRKIKDTIENDCLLSNRFASCGQATFEKYSMIRRFNEYQIHIIEGIFRIKQQNADASQSSEEIVIAILNNYSNNFFFVSHINEERIQFEDYVKYNDFYENLDNFTFLLLSDNLLSLKNRNFSNLVHLLVLSVLSKRSFVKNVQAHSCDNAFDCDHCAQWFIPFKYRLEFRVAVQQLLDEMSRAANDTMSPIAVIRSSLRNIPNDEFLLTKCKTYLKVATEVATNDIKGVLVIMRALQVFGEILKISSDESFVSGFMLSAILTSYLTLKLQDIRNRLSHYYANRIQGRIYLESNVKEFGMIQSELVHIYHLLDPVFNCQQLKIEEFMIQQWKDESRVKSRKIFYNMIKTRDGIVLSRERWNKSHGNEYKSFVYSVLNFFKENLRAELLKVQNHANYTVKIEEIESGIQALNLLFNFIVKYCDESQFEKIVGASEKLKVILQEIKDNNLSDATITNVTQVLLEYEHVLQDVFWEIPLNPAVNFDFSSVKALPEKMKDFNIFTSEEICSIKDSITKALRSSSEACRNLKGALTDHIDNHSPLPDITHDLGNLIVTKSTRKKIKKLFHKYCSTTRNILDKLNIMDENTVLGNTEEETCAKLLDMFEKVEYKDMVLDISFESPLQCKILKLMNQKVEFLISRINHIKTILIDEDDEISSLLKWGRTNEIKKHTKFLMRQRYLREMDVRAALEMLIFDIMNILGKRSDLGYLYTKSAKQFAGVNIRDFLSHGNIVFELVGGELDPEDWTSEFIDKMLELIADGQIIKSISDLWEKYKPKNWNDLKSHIVDGKTKEIDNIKKCTRWESYARLLPVN